MPILTTKGYQLTPDLVGALSGGLQVGQQFMNIAQQAEQRRKQQQIQELLTGQVAQQTMPTEHEQMLADQTAALAGESPQAMAEQMPQRLSREELVRQARAIDPMLAEKTLQSLGMDDASKRAEASRDAARILSLPPQQQEQAILERAARLRGEGRDASHTLSLLNMNQAERVDALQGVQMMDLSTKERFAVQEKMTTAMGKANKVQSSSILPDGTTIQIMGDGATRVTDPSGVELSGGARSQAIKDAQSYGVDIQQMRAQGRGLGKFTSKKYEQVVTQAENLRGNNDNLRQVISEVRGGADTGPLMKHLPTIRASSMRLKNLRNRLGLDVIGSVTFGALSEAELNMALETALPEGLDGPELIKWAEDKIDAQEKLASYLEQQADYLQQPGATPSGWTQHIKKQRQTQKPAAVAPATQPAGQAQKVGRFTVQVVQ